MVKNIKAAKDTNSIADTGTNKHQSPHLKNCDDLLFSLIDKSSFNPDVKKFKYSIWVDSLSDGIAKLKITMRNTELHEDRVISWLKLDFNMPKLTDITGDEPVPLTFDTVVLNQIIKNCRIR